MTEVEGERGAKVRFPPPLVYLASIPLGVAMRYAAGPLAVATYRYLALAAGGRRSGSPGWIVAYRRRVETFKADGTGPEAVEAHS